MIYINGYDYYVIDDIVYNNNTNEPIPDFSYLKNGFVILYKNNKPHKIKIPRIKKQNKIAAKKQLNYDVKTKLDNQINKISEYNKLYKNVEMLDVDNNIIETYENILKAKVDTGYRLDIIKQSIEENTYVNNNIKFRIKKGE